MTVVKRKTKKTIVGREKSEKTRTEVHFFLPFKKCFIQHRNVQHRNEKLIFIYL